MEKVSVIVPMYNVEKYVRRCLESLLTQTYPLIEIIAISDASPDKSAAIADAMAAKINSNGGGKTLIVNKLKENVGVGKVRDIGIEIATGKYLMFVDSDDYVHPQIVATCVEAMERNECQLVEVNWIRTSKFSIDFENIPRPKYRIEEGLRIEECSDHICYGKLYITDMIKDHALKMRYRFFEDTAFTRAYSLLCEKAVFISEVMYFYYTNPSSITAKMSMQKIRQSISRTNDVINVYKHNGLIEKAERFRISSQQVLIKNLMRMSKQDKLELIDNITVKDDTKRIINLFNYHRTLFELYGCYRLGIRFTIKRILRKVGLKK